MSLAVLVGACGAGPEQVHRTDSNQSEPVSQSRKTLSTNLQQEIERSELLGRKIFEKDVVAARATDVLMEAGVAPGDRRIHGWLTLQTATGWTVYFVGEADEDLLVFHEVRFPGGTSDRPVLHSLRQPRILTGNDAAMFRARQTASAGFTAPCDAPYNSVVLPGELIGVPGWLVYLLQSTTTPGVVVAGGHYRVHVSDDGKGILDAEPLARSCLVIEESIPEGTRSVGAFMSHVVTDWPLETHVFLSLLHDKPMYVITETGTWEVEAGIIKPVDLPN